MHSELVPHCILWFCVLLREIGKVSPARHTVYWNSTNSRFHGGNYTVRVHINDYVDIVCPHYAGTTPQDQAEAFHLYMVGREGYRNCRADSADFKRWECDQPFAPFAPIRFLEKIQLFTPFSLGFEFRPGMDYYYISIPRQGAQGRCQRLRVSVCCEPTLKPTTAKAQRPWTEEGVQRDASKSNVRGRAPSRELGAGIYLLCLLLTSVPWWFQGLPGA